MKHWIGFLAVQVAMWGQAAPQADQEREIEPPSRVARLAFLEGPASFQAAGGAEWVAAGINHPMTSGDRLYVEDRSRAELNTGAAAYRLGARTGVNIDQLDDNITRLILTEGVLSFRVKRLDDRESIEIDTPNGAVRVARPGLYRVNVYDAGKSEAIAMVGELSVNGQIVRHMESGIMSGSQGNLTVAAMPGRDNFDQWAESRDRLADRSQSARYVAPGTIGYEDLDANGAWDEVPEYGRVWRPRVAVGWAPYRFGRWAWVAPWGWTWVDEASWGFAPFHYGRWAYAGASWCWVPGPVAVRPVYAPAMVSFHVGGGNWGVNVGIGAAPVSWVPLAPGEVWAPGFRATPGYWERVNVRNTTIVNKTVINNYYTNNNVTNVRNTTYANQAAPGAVTSASREAFANSRPVHQSIAQPAAGRAGAVQPTAPAAANPGRMSREQGQPGRLGTQPDRPIRHAQAPPPGEARPEIHATTPEPGRAGRAGGERPAASRPPEHISRENVRPPHVERREHKAEKPERP